MAARLVAAALVLLAAACAPERPASPLPSAGPAYSVADIHRLDFQGIRLGMARDEVCRRLIANGYRNWNGGDCGPLGHLEEGDEAPGDDFRGSAPGGWCHPDECRPGTPSGNVMFVSLEYERLGRRDIVRKIGAWTAEPGRRDELAAQTMREWGQPTFHARWAYTVLNYAPSARQADFYNRSDFDSCRYSPGCAEQRGKDCGAVLSEFGTPHASVVVFDWGRTIEIEDVRPYVRALRASGALQGRRFIPNYACMAAAVH